MIARMPWISQESPKSYFEKLQIKKKIGIMTHLTVKKIFKKINQTLQFLMVLSSLNPNITYLGEKL